MVEVVTLQEVFQLAVLSQILPQGLLSDEGNPGAKGWFGGGRIIRQKVCSWGAVEALERKESWPKRGQRKEVKRGDASILGKIIQRSSVVVQSHLAH